MIIRASGSAGGIFCGKETKKDLRFRVKSRIVQVHRMFTGKNCILRC